MWFKSSRLQKISNLPPNAFAKFGGSLGETGSVSWMFEKKGQIIFQDNSIGFDALFDIVLMAGAEDINKYNEEYTVTTPIPLLMEVRKVIEDKGCVIKSADYEMLSKTTQKLEGSESEIVINLLASLEDNDDVNKLFSNLEIE